MDKVYHLRDFRKFEEKSHELLSGFYPKNSEVFIKIHFGEPGNKFAFFPKDIEPIINALKALCLKPVLIDSPVAYSSPRNSISGYLRVVKKKGYDKISKCLISNTGIKIKTRDFTAEVIKELEQAENVLVLTHVKGHSSSGFGGAVKNLGMGGVTVKTKNLEHDLCKPSLKGKCHGCQTCVNICPEKAISFNNNKIKIDLGKCFGCSLCEIKCPYSCLKPHKAIFDDLLAQGASAVIKNLPKKTYYINVIKNVSRNCDCVKNPGGIIAKDIGILFSENPVAIDKASIDLINKATGKNVFLEAHHCDPLAHINFAAGYLKKSTDYKISEI